MINYKDIILSQYANSPKMISLIQGFAQAVSPDQDIQNFYETVYNISTASGFGLDNWGIILDIPRSIKQDDGKLYYLEDESFRFLLLIRAMANVSTCTIPNLVSILNNMFANRGKCYVFDVGVMKMKYVFDFYLTDEEKAILQLPNIPPKPTGVQIEFKEYPSKFTFGFNGTGFRPFNQGTFRTQGFEK